MASFSSAELSFFVSSETQIYDVTDFLRRSYPCGPGKYSSDGIEHGHGDDEYLDGNGFSINENVLSTAYRNIIMLTLHNSGTSGT